MDRQRPKQPAAQPLKPSAPHIDHDLLLIGAGHAQLSVIRRLAMKPVQGLRAILVSDERRTPYSGMLPGVIAGAYEPDALYIDLDQLCGAAGVEFIQGRVVGLDPSRKVVTLNTGVKLHADSISINPGGAPQAPLICNQPDWLLTAKPIGSFWAQWQSWLERWVGQVAEAAQRAPNILVVGGGAAGVEIAFAVQNKLTLQAGTPGCVTIASTSRLPLPSLGAGAGRRVLKELVRQDIIYRGETRVEITEQRKVLLGGSVCNVDLVIWAAGVDAPGWLAESGLACNQHGFASIDANLQSKSHPGVFLAGDAVDFVPKPLPKAGVYSVRMGPVLAKNLVANAVGGALTAYRPQARTLFLLGNGQGKALAWYGGLSVWGRWLWRWKDRIDRQFMARFGAEMTLRKSKMLAAEEKRLGYSMRCEGCAAKVEGDSLNQALTDISARPLGDAALLGDSQWVQSVDAISSPVGDPYLHGFIAVIHALSDLYVSGSLMGDCRPQLAVQVTVARGRPANEAARLSVIMQGVMAAALQEGADVITGHSATGQADQVSVTVSGQLKPPVPVAVDQSQPVGVFLSKPLGVGMMLVARMRGEANSQAMSACLDRMTSSNRVAADVLRAAGALCMTDVTGFGLANHLQSILPDKATALLDAKQLPRVKGLPPDRRSSIFLSNALHAGFRGEQLSFDEALAFDPQTSGGVVALVPMVNRHLIPDDIVQIGTLEWGLDSASPRVMFR